MCLSSFRTRVDICNTNNTSPSSFFLRGRRAEKERRKDTRHARLVRARAGTTRGPFFFSICVVVIVNFIVIIIIVSFCQMPLFFRIIVLFASFVSSDIYFSSSRGFNKTLIIIIIVRDVFFFFFFFFFCCLSMDDTNRFCRPNEATTARPWCIRAAARPTEKASVREDKKSRLWD